MSEFKLHHLVTQLLESLGSSEKPEELVELLQKSIDANNASSQSYMSVQSQIQRIADSRNNAQPLLNKFEDLKQKNVDCLAQYVDLVDKIIVDPGLVDFLQKTTKSSPSSCMNTNITKDNLSLVKNRLKSATAASKKSSTRTSKLLNKSNTPTGNVPSVSSWVQRRPSMSWDFSSRSNTSISNPLNGIPAVSQETILIEDLLNILMGLPANNIDVQELKDSYEPREFLVNEQIDTCLRDLIKQILPLASHYSIVQRFTEEKMRFEYGQVNNALAECMSSIITDYLLFITQLETEFNAGNLNLHKMWYYIQDNLHSLSIVSNIATTINKSDASGGKVLSLLHDNIAGNIGNSKAQDLCVKLMQAACVPYMKMLGMWIFKGIISDPIKEFLVEDNEVVQKEDMPIDYSADYWDRKYTIRRERIPKFLEPVSDIILRAGKYLNVIRQCGKSVNNKVHTIEYEKDERHYIEQIEMAYNFASQTLMNVVMVEQDLLGRLRSVKHYFLLDQGDFIVTFLTLCEKELNKEVADVVQGRLDSLLDLALRLSSATNDVYKDDLRTELLPYDLQTQMFKILMIQTFEEDNYRLKNKPQSLSVIESFSFSYEVRWPLSLILNWKTLACYQMIFRHLFYCKHVERMICQVWRSNKVAKKFQLHIAQQYRSAFALRQRMLHCVQNLEYHMMVEVIEPHWCVFQQNIAKVNNVDEVLTCHSDFQNACLKDCMLTMPNLLKIIIKLLSICVRFCKFMQRTQRYFVEAELGSLPNSLYESYLQADPINEKGVLKSDDEEEEAGSFEDSIGKFDLEFTESLMELLDQINELNRGSSDHDRLFNLLYRLDFNSFYSGQFTKLGKSALKTDTSG